jgi:transcriptional regulator with XRE-family HTH domain
VKKINEGVGKRIKAIRTERGMSQQAFGAIIGVSQRYVGMMEQGLRRPSKGLIIAICARFKKDEGWLCSGRKG